MPLTLACKEHGIPLAEIVDAIEASAHTHVADPHDWNSEPLAALIDHIIATYHDPLREELPRLDSMAMKVSRVHGMKARHLARLTAIVAELSADLQLHMRKEELVLFPAIRTLEGSAQRDLRLEGPITVMEHEHDDAGALLSEARNITDGYAPPEWACETLRALYHGLSELEADMHLHVHLENNILFPRALALEAPSRSAAPRSLETPEVQK
jgi:regulator of cell morphogenesis and NO signaling